MLSELQKQTAQAIVNIFETGSARGKYGEVTVLSGDSGHLTYGRAQTTLASGNLYLLIRSYVEEPGARYASDFEYHLPALESREIRLDGDLRLHRLLRDAGEDPVMHEVQDGFFDRVYWNPALTAATTESIASALGTGIIYDSLIHGSWLRIRNQTRLHFSASPAAGEKTWVGRYVNTRRQWLASHTNRLLRRTVYRMDAFNRLIDDDAWDLPLPLVVRGVTLDETVLGGSPVRVSAEEGYPRLLKLTQPYMSGDDVMALQRCLIDAGHRLSADGVFGPSTKAAVKAFQQTSGLTVDGIVGRATRSRLSNE